MWLSEKQRRKCRASVSLMENANSPLGKSKPIQRKVKQQSRQKDSQQSVCVAYFTSTTSWSAFRSPPWLALLKLWTTQKGTQKGIWIDSYSWNEQLSQLN